MGWRAAVQLHFLRMRRTSGEGNAEISPMAHPIIIPQLYSGLMCPFGSHLTSPKCQMPAPFDFIRPSTSESEAQTLKSRV